MARGIWAADARKTTTLPVTSKPSRHDKAGMPNLLSGGKQDSTHTFWPLTLYICQDWLAPFCRYYLLRRRLYARSIHQT